MPIKHFMDIRDVETVPLSNGESPTPEMMKCTYINVKGRKEHEKLLKDHKRCKELGLDIFYETAVYLKRWGGWLDGRMD